MNGPGRGDAGALILDPRGVDRPLLPFLPLIHTAWADGELTAAEISAVREQVQNRGGLDEEGRRRLGRWLDPENPPPAGELAAVLRLVRDTCSGGRQSLAELGLDLARGAGGEAAVSATTARALDEVEAGLGIAGAEAAAEMLATGVPVAVPLPAPPPHESEPQFDVAALALLLDGEHHEVRRRVRGLLAEPAFAPPGPLSAADYRRQVGEWLYELARRGLGALSYPRYAGGADDLGRFVAAFETLGYGDLSLVVELGVQFGLFGGSILMLGNEEQRRRYLGAVGRLELPGCFAMSETAHGSNVRDLETTARYDPERGDFVVHTPHVLARKDWIGNAARDARMATVFAQLLVPVAGADEPETGLENHGVHALLVPIRDADGHLLPGVAAEDCGHKEGLNGVDNGRLSFDHVRVPRENLLDRFGSVRADGVYESAIPGAAKRFFTMLGTLVGGRISVAAAAVSAAKSGLASAVRYGVHRRQFGPPGEPETPILDYQAHQRRLLPRLAAAYAYHFAARWLVQRFLARSAADAREVETLAAGIKAMASWQTVDTLQTCRECCGGQGYLSVNRFGRLKDDTDVFTTFEGDNTVLLLLVARGRLGAWQKRFGEMRAHHLVGWVLRRAAAEIAEKNPVVTRRTGSAHLRDPGFLAGAFAYREETLLTTVARRLKARLDAGMDSFAAFDECQDHLLALARAFVERVVLERFHDAVRGAGDPPLAEVLGQLAALWGLWRLHEDAGWFLESGYLEGPKAGAVRAEVLALCRELRPAAVPLVDAFAVPRPWLAPIAFGAATRTAP